MFYYKGKGRVCKKTRTPIVYSSKLMFGIGLVAFVVALVVIGAQTGQAQDGGHPLPLPDLHPVLVANLTDSWNVPVKNACLVDSVTVKAGQTTMATREFKTSSRTNEAGAEASAAGKAACDQAKAEARKELPKELWAMGDKLCMEDGKAPKGKKQCKAVRGNLDRDDIQCSCSYKGLDPIQERSREWEVKATCTNAKAVDYVCDP